MKLEIESEKVLKAAEKCPEWKEGLKTLFPEAFEDDSSVNLEKFHWSANSGHLEEGGNILIEVRSLGNLTHKAFWLNAVYTWKISFDDTGQICLVPAKK